MKENIQFFKVINTDNPGLFIPDDRKPTRRFWINLLAFDVYKNKFPVSKDILLKEDL